MYKNSLLAGEILKARTTRNCVYERLCPQPLVCPPYFSPGNLFIILFQLSESEATCCNSTSCNSFRDIFIGSFRCPNLHLHRALTMQRAITKKQQINIF